MLFSKSLTHGLFTKRKGSNMLEYFEGWYFKQESENHAMALIPAWHRTNRGKTTASLQIITKQQSCVLDFPFTDLTFNRDPLTVVLGNNIFSHRGICLNIQQEGVTLQGRLYFNKVRKPLRDIMGPFNFVPLMQCRHSVFSLRHNVEGKLEFNSEVFDFSSGSGYIEGDRGRSFPKEYLWSECNFDLHQKKGSIMLAVADIPMGIAGFTGVIGFVYLDNVEYRFATYLGAKIEILENALVKVVQGAFTLVVERLSSPGQILRAPQSGVMNRLIRESLCCRVKYQFSIEGKVILDFISETGSFEYEY